jgi:hypothetical protein
MNMKTQFDKFDVITPEGTYVTTINKALVAKQGLGDVSLELLKLLHVQKYLLLEHMKIAHKSALKGLHKQLLENNCQLQKVWGFPVNQFWYRFWEEPRCLCPHLDNQERFPFGMYIINGHCPVHGSDND